jgi:hypothetical protein
VNVEARQLGGFAVKTPWRQGAGIWWSDGTRTSGYRSVATGDRLVCFKSGASEWSALWIQGVTDAQIRPDSEHTVFPVKCCAVRVLAVVES